MEVIIQIEGRDAIPVRAIPLLTYWQTMTPDALALALEGDEHYCRFENMQAYSFDDGRVLPAGFWTNNVVRPLRASSDTIKVHEISHEAGLQEFRNESLQKLPAGVYVWRDEFTEAHQRHYSKITLPLYVEGNDVCLTDAEVAKLTAAHQERITLDFSPFIDPSMHALVMQGFGVLPTDTAPAQTAHVDITKPESVATTTVVQNFITVTVAGAPTTPESEAPAQTNPPVEQVPPSEAPAHGVAAEIPDTERRLALLREIGGSAKYKDYKWKFTGTKALVAREKADGRKRFDEKTVRADLKEAAQAERDANRARFTDGLGQR